MTRVEALQILQATEAQMTVGDNWREVVDPSFYVKAGWPQLWVDSITKRHSGAGDVVGVWHPDFLQSLCAVLGVSKSNYESIPGIAAQCRKMAVEIWMQVREGESDEKSS